MLFSSFNRSRKWLKVGLLALSPVACGVLDAANDLEYPLGYVEQAIKA
jgi:hypothetical protein